MTRFALRRRVILKLIFTLSITVVLFHAVNFLLLNAIDKRVPRQRRNLNAATNKLTPDLLAIAPIPKNNQPFILIYNDLYAHPEWYSRWNPLPDSKAVYTLHNCPIECHYTFDQYFQRHADLVLVHISAYETWTQGRQP